MKLELEIGQQLSRQFGQFISNKQAERSLLLIQGILESRTVNLWSCAEAVGRQAATGLTRGQLYAMFLDHFQTGRHDKLLKGYFLAVFFLTFHLSDGRLVMDRTEWQIGSRWHNLLVIGYICHDSLVPLVWVDLGQRKSSSTDERVELLDRLLAWWRATGVPLPPLVLHADREFIGSGWFRALVKRGIQFVVRLRENQSFHLWRGGKMTEKAYSVQVLNRYLKRYGLTHVEMVVGDEVILPFAATEAMAEENGAQKVQRWFLAANIGDPGNAGRYYDSRWCIETTFGHAKTKGLNLEDFNLIGSHKMEIMLGLVSIVYALSIRQTLEEKLHEDVEVKTYKDGKQYPARSTFRLGLERVREIVRNVNELFLLVLGLFDQVRTQFERKIFILNKSIVQ